MQDDRLYMTDAYIREFDATVVDSDHGWCVLSQTAFYPGGGGQPPDGGWLIWNDETLAVRGVRDDAAGRVWHDIGRDLPPAAHVRGTIDWPNRNRRSAGEKFENRGRHNKRFYWELEGRRPSS